MYTNPMNDFYLRQAQPYQQPYQQPLPFPSYEPQINSSWVSSIEEARAAQMNFSATNVYLDTSCGKIYLKRIGDNGKPQFLSYVVEEEITPKDPLTEINTRLSKIEQYLGGHNAKSISGNADAQQSARVSNQSASISYERNEETESTGLPESYGADQWEK